MKDQQTLVEWLVELTAETLRIPGAEIDPSVHIQDLGFNSTHLIGLVDRIGAAFGEEVHPGVFFEHTSLEAFAGYLLEERPDLAARQLETLRRASRRVAPGVLEGRPAANGHAKGASNGSSNGHTTAHSPGCPSGCNAGDAGGKDAPADAWASIDSRFFDTAARSTPSRPATRSLDGLPVVVGGSIGAMLISRKLIEKRIPHVIVGRPTLGDSPKLGESMTESVSIEFTRHFKEYSRYFFAKEVTPFYMGKIVSGLRFGFFKTFASLFEEHDLPDAFIHIDRVGFDAALYEEVGRSEYAHWIDSIVTRVDYCGESDRVRQLVLEDGRVLDNPSFVWDCTNHVRLLGRSIGIPYKDFDSPRRVFFTHYFQKDASTRVDKKEAPWFHATSLLNADPAVDGMKGVSWLIPLGSYVSVGISIEESEVGSDTPEEILTKLTRAYQRRGLDYTRYFPRRKEVVSVPSQHFMYDRFVGGNWALVGGSAASTWFTSGSQISMLCVMGCMADQILQQPEVYGEYYSRHVRGFAGTQEVYDTLLDSELGAIDAMKFLSRIVEQGRKRISSYYMFRTGLDNDIARVASELWHEKVVVDKTYLLFLRQLATHAMPAELSQQTEAIFAKLAELEQESGKVVIPYLKQNAIRRRKPQLFLQPA